MKRVLAVLAGVLLAVGCLGGCSGGDDASDSSTPIPNSPTSRPPQPEAPVGPDGRAKSIEHEAAHGVIFPSDGQTVVTFDAHVMKIWNWPTLELRISVPMEEFVRSSRRSTQTFSADGSLFALIQRRLPGSTQPPLICLFDAKTLQETRTLSVEDGHQQEIAFSPDGKTLASGGLGDLRLWELESGQPRQQIADDSEFALFIFSPDAQMLAYATGPEIRIWGMKSGKIETTIAVDSIPVKLRFSPDSTFLSAMFRSDGLRRWDAKTGQPKQPGGHISDVIDFDHSPAGNTIACVERFPNRDTRVALRDGETLEEIASFPLLEAESQCVFSPDGRFLALPGYTSVTLLDVSR